MLNYFCIRSPFRVDIHMCKKNSVIDTGESNFKFLALFFVVIYLNWIQESLARTFLCTVDAHGFKDIFQQF